MNKLGYHACAKKGFVLRNGVIVHFFLRNKAFQGHQCPPSSVKQGLLQISAPQCHIPFQAFRIGCPFSCFRISSRLPSELAAIFLILNIMSSPSKLIFIIVHHPSFKAFGNACVFSNFIILKSAHFFRNGFKAFA